jgi:hypothetical protein
VTLEMSSTSWSRPTTRSVHIDTPNSLKKPAIVQMLPGP